MLDGIRTAPIVCGAYTDNRGGVCPMLAAHRHGGRTSFLSFAKAWDAFARARRVRRATRRELRTLEHLLEASLALESDTDLAVAIAEHRAALERRAADTPEITARRLRPGRVRLLRGAQRTEAEPTPTPTASRAKVSSESRS